MGIGVAPPTESRHAAGDWHATLTDAGTQARAFLANLTLLQRAFAASLLMHAALFLFDPLASRTLIASDRIAISVTLETEPTPAVPADVSELESENEDLAPAESTAAEAAPVTPEQAARPPALTRQAAPVQDTAFAALAEIGDLVAATFRSVDAPAPLDVPGTAEAARDASGFDEAEAEALLARVIAAESAAQPLRRYKFEVRERIRECLLATWTGMPSEAAPEVRSSEEGLGKRIYLLRFRVDRDGYIFDLSLRRPPGSPAAPKRLRREILALSPLAPPPGLAAAALDFEFVVE